MHSVISLVKHVFDKILYFVIYPGIFLVFRDASLIVAERSTNAANAVHVIRVAPVGVCGAREWDYPADK